MALVSVKFGLFDLDEPSKLVSITFVTLSVAMFGRNYLLLLCCCFIN